MESEEGKNSITGVNSNGPNNPTNNNNTNDDPMLNYK
jgi:hypothetical protein